MGNVYNRLLQHNAPTTRGLTCCKILLRHWALRKLLSTKLPLGGEGGGVNHIWLVAYYLLSDVYNLNLNDCLLYTLRSLSKYL